MQAPKAYDRIYAAVRDIPAGQVMSYGEVAKAAGFHSGARLAGWALKALPPDRADIPWHRVVNRQGVLSIANERASAEEQARRLRSEGVTVVDDAGALRVAVPRWFAPAP